MRETSNKQANFIFQGARGKEPKLKLKLGEGRK